MRLGKISLLAGVAVSMVILTACGGGGGGVASASTTPPPATPTPAPTATVTVFATPTVGQYATVGASAAGQAWTADVSRPVGSASTAEADQPHIRYTGNGTYEVQLGGGTWSTLAPYGQGTGDYVFRTPDISQLVIAKSRDQGYQYSEIASWTSSSAKRFGAFAFGLPTLSGQMPFSGSGTFAGIVRGQSDVIGHNSFDGSYRMPVDGTVALNFDFARGSLTGSMTLALSSYSELPLGTFQFKDTVFSAGSTVYSGRFDTAANGQNSFLGQFTGPRGEESIGAWALPFILNAGNNEVTADGQTHQAFGAWIAKSH